MMVHHKRNFPTPSANNSSHSNRCKAYFFVNALLISVLLTTSAVNYFWTADILYRHALTNSSTQIRATTNQQQVGSKLLRQNKRAETSKMLNEDGKFPAKLEQDVQVTEYFGIMEELVAPDAVSATIVERENSDVHDPSDAGQDAVSDEVTKLLEDDSKKAKMEAAVPDEMDFYSEQMKAKNLTRSLNHQRKFVANKASLATKFPMSKRVRVDTGEHATIKVNEEYAYVHIFKSGGTTIHLQTGRVEGYIDDSAVADLKWFSFVRDPIDHFLSGWAECGDRDKTKSDKPYDDRIREWLQVTKTSEEFHCSIHSLPQANFLLNQAGELHDRIEFIGDLSEMAQVLELTGFEYDAKRGEGRVSAKNYFKLVNYPTRQDMISDETMKEICDFVAIDYFLFDFEPPEACIVTLS